MSGQVGPPVVSTHVPKTFKIDILCLPEILLPDPKAIIPMIIRADSKLKYHLRLFSNAASTASVRTGAG